MTPAAKFRTLAADIRTAAFFGFAILALHGWWFICSEHMADVISGFGVSTAVLGILVAAQPLMKVGIETTARREVGLVSKEREQEIKDDADAVAKRAARRLFLKGGGRRQPDCSGHAVQRLTRWRWPGFFRCLFDLWPSCE